MHDYCLMAGIESWSDQDTPQTRTEIQARNANFACQCLNDCPQD